jgi:hypothetical protein
MNDIMPGEARQRPARAGVALPDLQGHHLRRLIRAPACRPARRPRREAGQVVRAAGGSGNAKPRKWNRRHMQERRDSFVNTAGTLGHG